MDSPHLELHNSLSSSSLLGSAVPKVQSPVDTFVFESIDIVDEITNERMKELETNNEVNQYIAFESVSRPVFKALAGELSPISKICRLSYYVSSKKLIIKIVAGVVHHIISQHFQIDLALQAWAMGLDNEIQFLGSAAYKLQDWNKEADVCWGLYTHSPIFHPTFVVETSLSESCGHLFADAHRWLENPASTINLVVTIEISQNLNAPKIVFRRFERANRICPRQTRQSANNIACCTQMVQLTLSNGNVRINGRTLTADTPVPSTHLDLPFSAVFNRQPNGPFEIDFYVSSFQLEKLAWHVWHAQGLGR